MSEENKIFVAGLSTTTTTEGLSAYFSKFGEVSFCNIALRPDGSSRCFGFVTFKDSYVCKQVLAKVHVLDRRQVRNTILA